MAGVGALLHRFATVAFAVSTVLQVAETAATGEAAANLAGANLRGLRANSQVSSHGLRANVFRAASRSRSTVHARLQQVPGAVPLYVPKMGLANVTDPTPFPPPPPVLHPWRDHQPLDTAVGNYLISGFIAQPTVTPPPTQASLDLAFACPALLTWPGEISVNAPDPCGSLEQGKWSKGKDVQIQWSTSCIDTSSPGISPPSVSPVTTYMVGNGDLFGSSQERQTLSGSFIEIRDCGGAVVYTVDEKIYKQAGKPDDDTCTKHKSCDGVVYFQYFIKNAGGTVVALTPYTTLFQESFDITDTAGGKIATVARNGWEPDDLKPVCSANGKPRLWNIKYAGSPPGLWAAATNQWPIAAFVTMMAQRDQYRQPDGQVLWSPCETVKATGWVLSTAACFCCIGCIPMVIFLLCSAPIMRFFVEAEQNLFPKRMGKPAMYGN